MMTNHISGWKKGVSTRRINGELLKGETINDCCIESFNAAGLMILMVLTYPDRSDVLTAVNGTSEVLSNH